MSEWIKCSERLPNDQLVQQVIVTDGCSVQSAVFHNGYFDCLMLVQKVTHWQPLPPPPTN